MATLAAAAEAAEAPTASAANAATLAGSFWSWAQKRAPVLAGALRLIGVAGVGYQVGTTGYEAYADYNKGQTPRALMGAGEALAIGLAGAGALGLMTLSLPWILGLTAGAIALHAWKTSLGGNQPNTLTATGALTPTADEQKIGLGLVAFNGAKDLTQFKSALNAPNSPLAALSGDRTQINAALALFGPPNNGQFTEAMRTAFANIPEPQRKALGILGAEAQQLEAAQQATKPGPQAATTGHFTPPPSTQSPPLSATPVQEAPAAPAPAQPRRVGPLTTAINGKDPGNSESIHQVAYNTRQPGFTPAAAGPG
jgi:hypothetical protein